MSIKATFTHLASQGVKEMSIGNQSVKHVADKAGEVLARKRCGGDLSLSLCLLSKPLTLLLDTTALSHTHIHKHSVPVIKHGCASTKCFRGQ